MADVDLNSYIPAFNLSNTTLVLILTHTRYGGFYGTDIQCSSGFEKGAKDLKMRQHSCDILYICYLISNKRRMYQLARSSIQIGMITSNSV